MKSSVDCCCNYGYMYCCWLWQQFSELEIYINYHEKKHLKLLIWEYAICILKRDILKENCRYICVPYDFNKFFAKILKFIGKRAKVLCQFICFKLQKETDLKLTMKAFVFQESCGLVTCEILCKNEFFKIFLDGCVRRLHAFFP